MMEKAAKTGDYQRLGTDLSIVVGDIVYALAIDAFLSINEDRARKEQALKYFIQTAVFTAMGEFIDTLHGMKTVPQVSEKDVFLNYSLKTARYTFDCPLVVGAILAGAGAQDIQLLAELGLLIGQAFQIQDDIIGVFETQKNIGKSILSDIAESKKTLLVCHAYSQLKGERKSQFMKIFTKPKITHKDLLAVRKIFIQTGSLSYSLEHILSRLRKSEKIFQQLQIKKPYRRYVEQLLLELFHQSRAIAEQNSLPF
jgi:geranylgeranyl diphosphate synthase type I